MKILLLGSGAREHALARALARDPQTTELIVAPGNPGTSGSKAVEYSITEEGRSELAAWWTRSVDKQPIERDELVLKIALAAGRSDVDALKILDTQRFATMKQLRNLNQQASEMPEERSARRLALEREIFDLEALSRWLDRAESLATPTSLSPTTKPEED